MPKTSILDDKEKLKKIVSSCRGYTEVREAYSLKGGITYIKRKIKQHDISVDHFDFMQRKRLDPNYQKKHNNNIFIKESRAINSKVKNIIIKENIIEYKCGCCGNPAVWRGTPIVLELDHINGNKRDHRINNLRFLCPNCHSITKTFSGRNHQKKKKEKIKCVDMPISCSIEINKNRIIKNISQYSNLTDILKKNNIAVHSSSYKGLNNLLLVASQSNPEVMKFIIKSRLSQKPKITDDPLKLFEECKMFGYSAVARRIGCSSNGIKKRLKIYNLI